MNELFRHALELAKAQASVREMSPEAIASFTTAMVRHLQDAVNGTVTEDEPQLVCDPKKAIRERSVTCCICGKSFKVLTKRHLDSHGVTADEYREMCGYKKGTALICRELRKARKRKMDDMKLWERRKDRKVASGTQS